MIDGHAIKGVSIGDLMFAGLIPVFWIMVCMLVAAYWQAVEVRLPEARRRQLDASSASPAGARCCAPSSRRCRG